MNNNIFVVGTNLAGVHGAGAAKTAFEKHGAVWGQGWGLMGNSYGIATKDRAIQTLPLDVIEGFVRTFVEDAKRFPNLTFNVTAVGCGLAGYTVEDIAPMFADVPSNCVMPERFKPWMKNVNLQYWDS
jgi:hypothetical protein